MRVAIDRSACSLRRPLAAFLAAVPLAIAGCAAAPTPEHAAPADGAAPRQDYPTARIRLEDPRADELVVVINNNSALGNHAGLFVGRRLSDPAGSYKAVRSQLEGWSGPELADYVGYQMQDGEKIQLFRFTLTPDDLSAMAARLDRADDAAPLFCAAAVQEVVAGIGPFRHIEAPWWTTPAELAELLHVLTTGAQAPGRCVWADGTGC